MSLKYLFNAEFQDGSVINQTQEDVSSLDPKRSQFYDVLEKDKEVPIKRFELFGDGTSLIVDLEDGHFDLNGVSFDCHETLPEDKPERRLIFYRKHTHNFNLVEDEPKEKEHIVEYCIGWQATIKGKNYKETVTIK
jgi:hypothetical protein